jgi:DNA-3-methyladenine glycosylase
MKLNADYYLNQDVVALSKDLLGKFLFTKFKGCLTGGMIVETEAYKGPEDRGSHAHKGRNTPRTRIMFAEGGNSYVYLCYGIHYLFNVVSGPENMPHAILIRGLEPTIGIEEMLRRRKSEKLSSNLTAGPGALAQALGITTSHNALSLQGDEIWLEDRGFKLSENQILETARVGMNFDGPWHSIPWRFRIRGNKFTSKAK